MLIKRLPGLILLLALFSTSLHAQKIATHQELEQIDGVYYDKSTSERFTGMLHDTTTMTGDFMQLQLVDGITHGLFEGFYDEERTITKWRVRNVNGKREGWYTSFFENGSVNFFVHMKDGKMEGKRWCFYDTGQLMHIHSYRNGIEDGNTSTYYTNGQLLEDVSYKKGVKSGKFRKYHMNGVLKQKGRFRNNQPDGILFEYDKSGKLKAKVKYKKGEKIKRYRVKDSA